MKRSACLLSLMSTLTIGCSDKDENSNSDSSTMSAMTGIITTLSASDSGSATEPTGTVSEGSATVNMSEPTSSSSSSTTFDPTDCGEAVVDIKVVTPSVMLVLDKSGSMVSKTNNSGFWDHDQDPNTPEITRWNSLYSVVELIVNNFNGSMNLGAVLFPSKTAVGSYNTGACAISATPEVPIAGMNAAKILATIPGPLTDDTVMKGGTPATKGLKLAIEELAGAPADQPKFMIFVTDGAANCQEGTNDLATLFEVYDEKVATTVAAALEMGISTYVVGIDISQVVSGNTADGNPDNVNTYEKLNLVASAGGVARAGDEKFYNTTNQTELQDALNMISMQILSCVVDLNPIPKFPDEIEVAPYGKDRAGNCDTEDGWQYLPGSPPQVQLCGQACTDFQKTGKLDIQYKCPDSV